MWLGLDYSYSLELWAHDFDGEATVTAEHHRECTTDDQTMY